MKTILVPPFPGNFSALGLLIADFRRDLVRTRVSTTSKTTIPDVRDALQALLQDADVELSNAGYGPDRRRSAASLDMRYAGQSFELSVPIALDVTEMRSIEEAFEKVYTARYGGTMQAEIEIVSYRIAAWGLSEKPTLPSIDDEGRSREAAAVRVSAVVFGGKIHDTPIFNRDLLPLDVPISGPAVLEEAGSSTIVPPDWTVELDSTGCLIMRRT
jgi:N-methylhydantoinase A